MSKLEDANVSDEDRQALAELAKLMADPTPFTVKATRGELWMLVAAVQLACRHPANTGRVREITESAARQIGKAITADNPVLADYLERGWDPSQDRKA